MTFQTIFGLSGISLFLAVFMVSIAERVGVDRSRTLLLGLGIFIISFLPLFQFSVNEYVRGLFNDLSITTIIIMLFYLSAPLNLQQQGKTIYLFVSLVGICFYPVVLGVGPVDPYSWGFINSINGLIQPLLFLLIIASIMLFCYFNNQVILLLCLTFATIAFQLKILESHNFWDYLLDPLIFFFAFYKTTSNILRMTINKVSSKS